MGAPSSAPSGAPSCLPRLRMHDQSWDLRPPPRRQSLESGVAPTSPMEVGVPHRWAPPPYPGRVGVGRAGRTRPQDLRLPWEEQRGVVLPQLGSRGTRGNCPRTPPSVRGEAAGLPGRFENRARPGRLQPSPPRSPVPLPAVSRRHHFRQPTRPGLSPRPDHPPRGALTAQRVPPLPPPSPKWRRRPPILLVAFL